ncbi:MAG: 23S rRNA (adenine(2503)-C(2))-methyltransferase RlmN [Gammaproteobacteria bacterium]|nr:23S rRNA (adenine(2503)-C(2))-methyltransferase RlmN [Gammaproteobacteria bacterium]MXW20180.1 23S rRNA (adenine(2503)-C(2))-methyltransferase RlmN [Gammaproteobacteria bacterium]MXZ26731.1 23S rRNA (adenine(2503)-C(2))-methyltransferase RlmN [Gammaproteobacteria bacterium]MYF58257.1 23S rRNA (adenine(2503)-C(2))-methyltransferase RlmN [Gammaproteobacteria bacterium]MYH34000.1 23S rRNA (adenine(2503)-C(2))-methyltransferase RlmN [Gammaproteobacteria bacterium]
MTREAGAVSLLGLPRGELEEWFVSRGEAAFRARQLMRWLYHRGELEPRRMTDMTLSLRESLGRTAGLVLPDVLRHERSADGTRKWLLDAGGGQVIETVFIPERTRGSLCVSSQVGCAVNCPFCATGQMGFNRNLSAAEIVAQVLVARREIGAGERDITNIVFMGMGEPLANFREVVRAASVFVDHLGLGLSRRRVTLSTSGITPRIRKLAQLSRVALALSLHAPDDELRNFLVPLNKRYPLGPLLDACWNYARETESREITFEYVMLDGVNDQPHQARALAKLLRDRPAKLNLIPYNRVEGAPFKCSPRDVIDRFRQVLLDAGIMTITRKTRGDDIDAACGQLRGTVLNGRSVPDGMSARA